MIKLLLTRYLTCRRANPTDSGFTLVEMLIYMALLSIFITILTTIFVNILEVKLESQATAGVEQDGRYILTRLDYDLSRATSVTTPASIGASSNTLVLNIGGSTHTYSLVSGNLQVTNPSGTYQLNSSETRVTQFSLQRFANASVTNSEPTLKTSFTIESRSIRQNGQPEIRTFETTLSRK